MDHNLFTTVNMEEGEDIYCQTALATAGISSPLSARRALLAPAEITTATVVVLVTSPSGL